MCCIVCAGNGFNVHHSTKRWQKSKTMDLMYAFGLSSRMRFCVCEWKWQNNNEKKDNCTVRMVRSIIISSTSGSEAAISIWKWNINVLCMDLARYIRARRMRAFNFCVHKMFSMRRPCRTYDKAMASFSNARRSLATQTCTASKWKIPYPTYEWMCSPFVRLRFFFAHLWFTRSMCGHMDHGDMDGWHKIRC